MRLFEILAALVLFAHLIWITWVLLGWLWTRSRPALAALHVASLVWGFAVEVGPWPCPLTLLEQWLETRAAIIPYHSSFLVRGLDAMVYPNVPETALTWFGGGVCIVILGVYATRLWHSLQTRRVSLSASAR